MNPMTLIAMVGGLVMAVLFGGNAYNSWWSPHAHACSEAGGFIYWRTAVFDQTCVKPIHVPSKG